jgi:hypothetical protein
MSNPSSANGSLHATEYAKDLSGGKIIHVADAKKNTG